MAQQNNGDCRGGGESRSRIYLPGMGKIWTIGLGLLRSTTPRVRLNFISFTQYLKLPKMSTLSLSLTGEQVDQYFDRIQLPQSYRLAAAPTLGNDLLSAIQLCHVTSIPYENLSLHYTDKVHVSLNITNIHAKLVGSPRGGYCMENNILFYHVLRFLGFDVYMAGARLLRDSGAWTGW